MTDICYEIVDVETCSSIPLNTQDRGAAFNFFARYLQKLYHEGKRPSHTELICTSENENRCSVVCEFRGQWLILPASPGSLSWRFSQISLPIFEI